MKKTFIYILALVIFFFVGATIATTYAADPENEASIENLIEEAKKAKREAVAQDMYLDVYQKLTLEPAKKAAKEAGKKLKMSGDDVNKVISEGNLGPILSKKEDETIAQLTTKYQKMYTEFYSTLETENLRSDLENKINPTEVFKDGDTSNSDFDILYDLTVIEVILFNESSISSYGGDFIMPDFDFSDPDELAELEELFGDEEDEEIIEKEEDEFTALECLEGDNNLQNALDAYEDSQTGADGDGSDADDGIIYDESGFPLAEPDDWPANFLCPEGAPFCINIEFDFKGGKVFTKSDNCIACHVQNINKEIDKMLAKPLSANKVAGNLFEVPKCKSSFTNLGANMNVITIAVPPPKQANTDMYVKLNIEKEWLKFQEAYDPFKFDTGDTEVPEQNVQDRASRKAVSNASPDATLTEIVNKANNVVQGKTQESTSTQTVKQTGLQTEIQNKQFQTLVEELDAWKQYFDSMKEMFDKMLEPCNGLANKPYCS